MQIGVIAELDRRQVALADGCRTMTDWISSRLDMKHEVAAELLTAAKAMPETLLDELGQAVVSFDRAITETRMHTSGVSPEVIRESRGFGLAGARRLAGRHRRITRLQERAAFHNQHVVIQPSLDGDGWRLFATMEGFEGSIVEKALLARSEELTDGTAPLLVPPRLCEGGRARRPRTVGAGRGQTHDSLYGEQDYNGSGDPIVTITADTTLLMETDGEAGAEITAGPRVGATTLQELLCIGKAELNIRLPDGNLMGVGKTSTSLPPRLRRAVISRDSGCVIDGCTSLCPLPRKRGPLPPSQASGGQTDLIHHVIERWHRRPIQPGHPVLGAVFLSPACGGRVRRPQAVGCSGESNPSEPPTNHQPPTTNHHPRTLGDTGAFPLRSSALVPLPYSAFLCPPLSAFL